jgi:hypothetical protein
MRFTLTKCFGAAALALMTLSGCASKAEVPPQATDELAQLRDQLMRSKSQVQTTTSAARDLTQRPQAQVQSQVDRFVQAVASLDGMATNNRQQFASADERAAAYFAHWDQQVQGMSPSMEKAGEKRREKSMKSHEELKQRVDALRAEFRPFMASMNEVSRYLQTDPTAAGVKAVTPQVRDALDREKDVMSKADAVIKQIDAMRAGN